MVESCGGAERGPATALLVRFDLIYDCDALAARSKLASFHIQLDVDALSGVTSAGLLAAARILARQHDQHVLAHGLLRNLAAPPAARATIKQVCLAARCGASRHGSLARLVDLSPAQHSMRGGCWQEVETSRLVWHLADSERAQRGSSQKDITTGGQRQIRLMACCHKPGFKTSSCS